MAELTYNSIHTGAEIDDAVSDVKNGMFRPASEQDLIDLAITKVIPSDATDLNQLATENFVNSSIGTNTAYYISNNGQPFTSLAQLQSYSGTVTNNDYAFVTGTDTAGNTYFDRYKATVTNGGVSWAKEYRLNNSSFTAQQWAALNSGITSSDKAKLDGYGEATMVITYTDETTVTLKVVTTT